ncbi:MAG TPA: PaaI family thioesterase [Usitatibacter sp.]|nr:PaaI family thioesterase [Usitatibacter sp.]
MSTAALDREVGGLEFLRRIVAGEARNVPIGETLGFRAIEVEPGRIVLAGKPGAGSLNLIGTIHGGWSAAILDTAMALAALSTLDARHDFTTLDLKLNFLRPIAAGAEVRAEGRVVHGGRRVALCEGRIADAAGKLLVHGTSSCLIVPRGDREKSQ